MSVSVKAAVLGSPISHSLSPLLHRTAYADLGIEASYEAIELSESESRDFFQKSTSEEWNGFSLTMPLKESVFDMGFTVEPAAARSRSANTLVREGNNFHALSTDALAFSRLLERGSLSRIAIIGGGGTARAALSALDSSSTKIDFLLRSPDRAKVLSKIPQFSAIEFFPVEHELQGYDAIISTVPTSGSAQVATLLERSAPCAAIFFEVLYNPSPTIALTMARQIGLKTIDGLELLVEQALDQIALFSQTFFDYGQMRTLLLETGRIALNS